MSQTVVSFIQLESRSHKDAQHYASLLLQLGTRAMLHPVIVQCHVL